MLLPVGSPSNRRRQLTAAFSNHVLYLDFVRVQHSPGIQKGKSGGEREDRHGEHHQQIGDQERGSGARSLWSEDKDHNGREETARANWVRWKLSQRAAKLLQENKPAAQVSVRRNQISKVSNTEEKKFAKMDYSCIPCTNERYAIVTNKTL